MSGTYTAEVTGKDADECGSKALEEALRVTGKEKQIVHYSSRSVPNPDARLGSLSRTMLAATVVMKDKPLQEGVRLLT